jgi:hypothetical protein
VRGLGAGRPWSDRQTKSLANWKPIRKWAFGHLSCLDIRILMNANTLDLGFCHR